MNTVHAARGLFAALARSAQSDTVADETIMELKEDMVVVESLLLHLKGRLSPEKYATYERQVEGIKVLVGRKEKQGRNA